MSTSQAEGFRRNHYVPVWYQRRFLQPAMREQKFYLLDKSPGYVVKGTRRTLRNDVLRWGPERCFVENDLYTTKFGTFESTEIERYFFGSVDNAAGRALDYFANFLHPSASQEAFETLVPFMSLQKLRTPKGLTMLAAVTKTSDKNFLLFQLQRLSKMYCALWTESIWSIIDASESPTKFIVSDHPVTVYNKACFPASRACSEFRDPDVWQSGTHTIYPLSLDRCLVLTNLSWVRDCYSDPLKIRPNPALFRAAMFNFLQIQVGRKLSEREVIEINHVIKSRAFRYVAAAEREWLYPERALRGIRWDRLGEGFLFMPDPRSVEYSGEVLIGFKGGGATGFDAYGRRPWQKDYNAKDVNNRAWNALNAFKGEFARRFGPKRRGSSYEFGRIVEEDDADYHEYHLRAEGKYKQLLKQASARAK
jgi:hypothetical protein